VALFEHLGHEPSVVEQILISRIISLEWQLVQIDAMLDGDVSVVELRDLLRTAHSAEMRLRLDLTALGTRPAAPVDKPVGAILASIHAGLPQDATAAVEDDVSEAAEP
jgi:hypothetical protein